MSGISLLSGTTGSNPATQPNLSEAEYTILANKVAQAKALLGEIAKDFNPATFANSLGAEDMVLTDLILANKLPLAMFSLDTGRLPPETYALMEAVEARYGVHLSVYSPQHEAVESYVYEHGINGFYKSVPLRQGCCHIRKVEPLGRALQGKKAWITGMRAQQSATRDGLATQTLDTQHGMEKFSPLADWSEKEVWAYIRQHNLPYNKLHDQFYPSIGCAPCSRAISLGEDVRAGRWWWESAETKECGLHAKAGH